MKPVKIAREKCQKQDRLQINSATSLVTAESGGGGFSREEREEGRGGRG